MGKITLEYLFIISVLPSAAQGWVRGVGVAIGAVMMLGSLKPENVKLTTPLASDAERSPEPSRESASGG